MDNCREELEFVQEQMVLLVSQKWELIKKIENSKDEEYERAVREYEMVLEEMEDLGCVLTRYLSQRERADAIISG